MTEQDFPINQKVEAPYNGYGWWLVTLGIVCAVSVAIGGLNMIPLAFTVAFLLFYYLLPKQRMQIVNSESKINYEITKGELVTSDKQTLIFNAFSEKQIKRLKRGRWLIWLLLAACLGDYLLVCFYYDAAWVRQWVEMTSGFMSLLTNLLHNTPYYEQQFSDWVLQAGLHCLGVFHFFILSALVIMYVYLGRIQFRDFYDKVEDGAFAWLIINTAVKDAKRIEEHSSWDVDIIAKKWWLRLHGGNKTDTIVSKSDLIRRRKGDIFLIFFVLLGLFLITTPSVMLLAEKELFDFLGEYIKHNLDEYTKYKRARVIGYHAIWLFVVLLLGALLPVLAINLSARIFTKESALESYYGRERLL